MKLVKGQSPRFISREVLNDAYWLTKRLMKAAEPWS
jgi:hypothetical protein